MRIAVFGTGGVGGYFGGRLARAGEEVTFIARGEHLHAIQASGLRIEDVGEDFTVSPDQARATDDPVDIGVVDVVLVATKGWQISEATEAIRPLVGPDTAVVPLLNGVEAVDQLAAGLGRECVLGGLCGVFGTLVAPGHIRNGLSQPFVAFGELDNKFSERVERLREAFTRAGVNATIPPDIQAALWEKLLFIASFGGVGAVTRAPMGVLRSVPETRRMLEEAMREIVDVARGREVRVAEDAVAKGMAFVDRSPPETTASMQRDLLAGRPSELESQNGAVVRLGREVDVATPTHTFIYSALLPLELRARGRLEFPA